MTNPGPCMTDRGRARGVYLGRRALLVRFCTRPDRGSNLGELPAGERPADPLDLVGDCFRCMRAGEFLWCGEGWEASGTGGGLMTMSTDDAWSGEDRVLAEGSLYAAMGGTSCVTICSRTFCQPAACLTSPVESTKVMHTCFCVKDAHHKHSLLSSMVQNVYSTTECRALC